MRKMITAPRPRGGPGVRAAPLKPRRSKPCRIAARSSAASIRVSRALRPRIDNGQWSGFDVDFCRALAAAIFNDPSKVQFVPLSASERFDALKNKQIDVLSRNSTWTMGRETITASCSRA